MSAPVDPLVVLDHQLAFTVASDYNGAAQDHRDLVAARVAVEELIERNHEAAEVFECILRGLNDLTSPMGHRSEPYVIGWMQSWAKSMHDAGFRPTNPEAPDIARALARIGGAK